MNWHKKCKKYFKTFFLSRQFLPDFHHTNFKRIQYKYYTDYDHRHCRKRNFLCAKFMINLNFSFFFLKLWISCPIYISNNFLCVSINSHKLHLWLFVNKKCWKLTSAPYFSVSFRFYAQKMFLKLFFYLPLSFDWVFFSLYFLLSRAFAISFDLFALISVGERNFIMKHFNYHERYKKESLYELFRGSQLNMLWEKNRWGQNDSKNGRKFLNYR